MARYRRSPRRWRSRYVSSRQHRKTLNFTLAQLVRYERVDASPDDARFRDATAKLAADDERRRHLDFTLNDLDGKSWTLRQLAGKVVLVNFWATWCPPWRKEMPDLDAICNKFRGKGLRRARHPPRPSFYDRSGWLAAAAINMRTERRFHRNAWAYGIITVGTCGFSRAPLYFLGA